MNGRIQKLCRGFLAALAVAGTLVLGMSSASAADLSWSANGTSLGGTGTWDTTNGRWGTSNPYNTIWNNVTNANDTAVFAGTAGTVTLSTPITAGGLTFNTTNYSITGSTLTLAGASSPIINVSTGTSTISSNIAGTNGLEKTGGGTIILSGTNNTYSGTTTLTAGTLRGSDTTNSLTPVSPFGSSSLTLNAGTTLDLRAEGTPNNTVETITYGNNTTVAGDATIHVQRFAGTSNNKIIALGTLSIGANTLTVTGATNYSLGFGATTLTGNAVFNANTGGLILGSISESGGSYSLTKTGSQSLQITGNTSYTGATTISAGNLQLGNGGTTGSLPNTSSFSINGTLIINRSNAFTQAADLNGHALTGSASFAQAGTGTTTLSLMNTYTGATAATAGTLSINTIADYGNDSAIGRGTAGTPIILGGGNNGATTGTLVYTGGAQSSNRTIQVGSINQNNTGGARIINNGTGALTFTAATFTPTYTQTNNNVRNLTLGGTNGGTINGTIQNISGTMRVGLIKVGSGTWALGGINTYTDNTDVHAGTLGLQSGATTVTQTLAALRFQVADGTLASNKTGAGDLSTTFTSVARAAGATGNFVSAGGTNGTDNSVNITGAAGFINAGLYFGGSEFASRNSTNGFVRALAYGSDTNAVAVNTITAGRHVKINAPASSFSGVGISLLSLNLQGDSVNWTNTSGTLTAPGILKSGGGSSTISGGNVTGGGNTELVVRTDLATDNLTISSNLTQGSGVLTKSGAGTLTLSGTNTYTGQTHVNAGTLSIGANVHLGAEATGATLNLKGGTLQATGTFGLFNGTAGTNNRNVTLLDQSGIAVTGSNTLTIAGVISNNANAVTAPGFNKTGTGTLDVSGVNTYTGVTNVNAGTLLVSGNGSINTTSAINVAAGARIANNSSVALALAPTLSGNGTGSRAVYGGTGTLNAALTLDNVGDVLSPGNSPGIQTFGVNQSWASNSYDWELNDWTASVAGTNIDQINITGNLTLTGAAPGSYILNVFSLTSGNLTGDVPNFSETNKTWTILTTTAGITGFNASYWTINTGNFTSSPTATGTWSVAQSGNNLILNYVAVPEPATIALLASGIAVFGYRLARRRPR